MKGEKYSILYLLITMRGVSSRVVYHSWHRFTENGRRRNIAQLWTLIYYITIWIFKISFRECVSSLLSTHYRTFIFTGPLDLSKAHNPAQKSIGTPKFYRDMSQINQIMGWAYAPNKIRNVPNTKKVSWGADAKTIFPQL